MIRIITIERDFGCGGWAIRSMNMGLSNGQASSARGRNSKGLEKFTLHGMGDRFQAVMGVEFLINVV